MKCIIPNIIDNFDEYQSCLINVEHHNLNFNGSYDRLMYNQLIVSLQEEKFKKLGI